MKPVVRLHPALALVLRARDSWYARYSWPVEFVVRAIKEIGLDRLLGRHRADAADATWARRCSSRPTSTAGSSGSGWFSTGAMLARMNFAATLASNQRFNLARDAGAVAQRRPRRCWSFFLRPAVAGALRPRAVRRAARATCSAGGAWTGSDAQLQAKAAGLARLIVGSSEYQFDVDGADEMHMAVSRREFIRDGVAAFTVSFAAPAFLGDIARAQGARSRNLVVLYLSGGNDALSTRRPVSGSVLLQPAADDRDPGRAGAADRQRLERQGARPASAADGPARHLQRGPARDRPAHRLRELEPLALPGHRHLGHRRSGVADRASAGSAAISTRCRRRSIRSSGWNTTRETPRALLSRDRRRAGDSRCAHLQLRSPNSGAEALERARRRDAHRLARAGRPAAPRVRQRHRRAARSRRSIASASVANYTGTRRPIRTTASRWRCGPSPASIVRGIGTRVFWVQTGGFDTHAGAGQRRRRRLRQPDGHRSATGCSRSTPTCATRGC